MPSAPHFEQFFSIHASALQEAYQHRKTNPATDKGLICHVLQVQYHYISVANICFISPSILLKPQMNSICNLQPVLMDSLIRAHLCSTLTEQTSSVETQLFYLRKWKTCFSNMFHSPVYQIMTLQECKLQYRFWAACREIKQNKKVYLNRCKNSYQGNEEGDSNRHTLNTPLLILTWSGKITDNTRVGGPRLCKALTTNYKKRKGSNQISYQERTLGAQCASASVPVPSVFWLPGCICKEQRKTWHLWQ